ncbi:Fis family transcriptional regulator [Sulfurimicrobium lacus]|uniref:Fis family transcriptional regulator n=1 Tax=Sulfurimicrobium lacus TaxID=2715678 RepID=A0A6F8V615_9PROT|nr:sigma-54 dependent transcriptional regulator [Sulfurimicrobium lacus]BCB25128.1 Fis family transcriptional regulator [Sulfurimicrobium lacus]
MNTNQILVVDDEAGIRELLREILEDEGYQVRLAENATAARAVRAEGRPDMVLLDIWMPDSDGITLLKEWASSGLLTMPVVMMSGHGTIDTAVEATRIGAFDFLEKPVALQKLLATVKRALKRGEADFRGGLGLSSLGNSAMINELQKRLEQVANLATPLLLLGEKGAGAELCARFLHQANTPLVVPETSVWLAEDPLEVLEQARDGVLFVTEIATLNKLEQKGLLFVLGRLEKSNVRLVCAASEPLPLLVEEGRFDAGLFQALCGLTLSVPALREHREDVPELANRILAQYVEAKEAPPRHFSVAALNALRNENWPGNLPQLNNVVKTLALTSLNEEITPQDVNRVLAQFATPAVAETLPGLPLDLPLREVRDMFERAYFEHHIAKAGGNMSRVAENVGLERTHLYRKLKQLGVRFSRKTEE